MQKFLLQIYEQTWKSKECVTFVVRMPKEINEPALSI
jgi:hypothetical protein